MKQKSVSTVLFKRSYLILGLIAVAFLILAFRIFILQTENYEKYQKEVISQMTTESVIPADRGDIYDTNGVLLATDVTVYRVFISPKDIQSAIKGQKNEDGEYIKEPRAGLDTLIAKIFPRSLV